MPLLITPLLQEPIIVVLRMPRSTPMKFELMRRGMELLHLGFSQYQVGWLASLCSEKIMLFCYDQPSNVHVVLPLLPVDLYMRTH